jgi:hypothetical protein
MHLGNPVLWCRNTAVGRKPSRLLRSVVLLPWLLKRLACDFYAEITGTFNNFIVRKNDIGGVEDVADVFDHSNVILGPIDPRIFLLDKEPFMDAAKRDGHTGSNLSEVSEI